MSVTIRPDGPGSVSFPISPTTGAVTVDVSRAESQTLTLTGDATIALAGFVAGRLMTVRMSVTQGAHAITWPASVHWLRGAPPPALTSTSEVALTSIDGGATILAEYTGHTEPDVQDFTASGTWTKPTGATRVVAELISGGGGACSSASLSNGGGGGGGYMRVSIPADSLAATESVVVGAGGSASVNAVGGAGGASSFATFTVPGGGGGTSFNSSTTPAGGTGGGFGGKGGISSFNGDDSIFGGGGGGSGAGTAGNGGSSGFGGGGGTGRAGNAGGAGGSFGAPGYLLGGAGGGPLAAGSAPGGGGGAGSGTGGAGARGQVRITTYFD